MRNPIPLLGQQSTSRITQVNDQQTINLYPLASESSPISLGIVYA